MWSSYPRPDGSYLHNQEENVNSQIGEMMTGSEVLERIRSMPAASFKVPRSGFERKRAIALKLGADHLDGYQSTMSAQQLAELDAYGTIFDGLVEAGYLLEHEEKPYLLGRAGVMDQDVFGYDVVYVIPGLRPTSNESIGSADDLLELIKEEGRFVFTTRFERGAPGFVSSIARYCGEEDSQTEHLLDFVDELQEAGRVTVERVSYAGSHLASKGERIDNLPSTLYIVRAA